MARTTFTVAGHKVKTYTQRRYVAWEIHEGYKPEIFKRSDSVETLRREIRRRGWYRGRRFIVMDTMTGDEIVGI